MTAINQYSMQAKYRLMPNRAAVTYRQQTAIGVYTDYAVADAWRRDLNDKEKMTSRGAYVEHESNFFIAKDQYSTQPMPGDLIVYAGNSYTALSMGEAGGLGTWKVRAVNLVLAAALRSTADIYTPTNSTNAIGSRVPSYPTTATYAAIPCKVQEITGDRLDVQGKTGFVRRYTCYLLSRVIVTTESQVRVDGVTYQVRAYNNPDRIDDLQSLDLEILP